MAESTIAVGLWAFLTEECPVEWAIDDNEAQIDLGTDPAELQLSVTEGGLVKLIRVLTDALDALRAARPGPPVPG